MRGLLLLTLLFMGPDSSFASARPQTDAQASPVILVVGDSLSAAYGIDPAQGWVSLLGQRLQQKGFPHRVVNASISGDTSQNGLYRLGAALDKHQPDIVILELGGNDGLRGLSLQQLRNNLAAMIEMSQQHDARVLLVGIRIPPNYGKPYTQAFYRTYEELARTYRTALVPFLLDAVGGRDRLMQADGIHPKAQGQPIMLDNVWPHLKPLLRDRRAARAD